MTAREGGGEIRRDVKGEGEGGGGGGRGEKKKKSQNGKTGNRLVRRVKMLRVRKQDLYNL